MANLSEQVEKLIETGPQQGIPPIAIVPIAQMLATVAKDLEHLQYFALRDPQQGWWLISTGAGGGESGEAEHWVAAFGHRADAERMLEELARVSEGSDTAGFEVVQKDAIELLFLALGLRRSAGLLLYEAEGDASKIAQGLPILGQGVRAEDLRAEMQKCLAELKRAATDSTIA